jgi:hypothetical protein
VEGGGAPEGAWLALEFLRNAWIGTALRENHLKQAKLRIE